MRNWLSRAGLVLTPVIVCVSLAGCAGSMFQGNAAWQGGTLINEKMRIHEKPDVPMQLTLRENGTGYAANIPQGKQKRSDNVCFEVTSDELYSGEISWRKGTKNTRFEISFADSTYSFVSGPEKWRIDWSEIRLYSCNPGPEWWAMEISCAQSSPVARENSWRCSRSY